jgi:hypothetical protein
MSAMEREHGPIRASRLGLLGRVVLLEFPLDTWVVLGTLLHSDLLLVLADGQTVFAAAVLHETGLWVKRCVNIFELSLLRLTSKHTSASYSQY